MKTAKKCALVPRLRFPAFREEGEWDTDALGEVAEFVNEKIPLERIALENYVSTENIFQDYGGVACASKLPATGLVTRFEPNDTLVSNIRPYLKKVWVADKKGGASNDVIVIRAKERLLPQYLSFLLRNDAFIDYVMTGAKGVKMPRGDIGSMKEYPTLYPSKAEQQKIVDCLSSLDDIITAQSQKIDALKTHKKGLMQQLFPAEGETVPRLRFPEFLDAGEWEENSVGTICEFLNNCRKPISSNYRKNGNYPYYGASGIVDYINDYIFDERLLLIGEDGAKWGAFENTAFIAAGKYWVNNHAHVLRVLKVNDIFLENYLVKLDFGPYITGAAPPKLTLGKLKDIPILFPLAPKEQQKIADCLSSLDELITLEGQKLDALKAHKKGLMQQIFPALDEMQE